MADGTMKMPASAGWPHPVALLDLGGDRASALAAGDQPTEGEVVDAVQAAAPTM